MSSTKEITLSAIAKLSSIVLILALISVYFYRVPTVEAAAQWVEIEINPSYVDADLTDFPIYIDLADLPAAFWDTTNCTDIRTFKSDGTTELAREIVSCTDSGSSGTGELHIKYTGTLSSSATTTIQLHYDGTSSDYAVTATYGRNNVWSDYEAVWHMEESSGTRVNSTGGTDLAQTGTVSNVSGVLGSASDFNSTSEQLSHSASSVGISNDWTIQFFVQSRATNGGSRSFMYYPSGGSANAITIISDSNTLGSYISLNNSAGTAFKTYYTASDPLTQNTWFKLAYTWDGTNLNMYRDGSSESTITKSTDNSGTMTSTSRALYVSNAQNGLADFIGYMDEVRVRTDSVSADWESTEYNNQNSPSAFYWVSGEKPEEDGGTTEEYIILFSSIKHESCFTLS